MVAKGRVSEERTGSLGLAEANYSYVKDGINKVLLHAQGNCIHYSMHKPQRKRI